MQINEFHFNYFKQFVSDPVEWPGKAPGEWAAYSLPGLVQEGVLAELPERKLNRGEVREYCADPACSDEACFIVIMAWGGRNAVNARRAWNHRGWIPLIRQLRQPKVPHDRRAIFSQFCQAHIPGLGPAYFTKIMYFLRPIDEGCYIFDQWTARSANLICATTPPTNHESLIAYLRKDSNKSMWLDSRNTEIEYENYCGLVEFLSQRIGNMNPEEIEEAMFAGGAHPRWRAYLRDNFSGTMSKIKPKGCEPIAGLANRKQFNPAYLLK